MTPVQIIGLVAEALLVLVWLGALVSYVRHRDPISRAVALMFSPFVGLLVTALWRPLLGPPPFVVSAVASVMFLLQPALAIHLVSLIRPVSRRLRAGAVALIAISVGPLFVLEPRPPWYALIPLLVFVGLEAAAAAYFFLESRRRTGPGARRLQFAAASTGLLAAALFVAGASVISPDVSDEAGLAMIGLALLAALGYVVAFMPPPWVRRFWQAGATVPYQRDLLRRSAEGVDQIWAGFAGLAASITGSRVAVTAEQEHGRRRVIASAGLDPMRDEDPLDDIDEPTTTTQAVGTPHRHLPADSLAARLADHAGATVVSTVSISAPGSDRPLTLLVLSRYHSLFHGSDLDLLATLGAQTAIVAERRAVLAEQEAMAARLAATVEALQAAGKAKSDFLASMSHELRTPLSAILGFSDLMRQAKGDEGVVQVPLEWVQHVHSGGEHLLSLVNDVLDLAKVEAGRLDLDVESVDLATVVSELLGGVRPLADRKDLRLASSVGSVRVAADRGRLRQVLYNLLSNAIKFTPDGGEIRVEAEASADEVRVSVVDSGIGIAVADQATVFEEFQQVAPNAQTEIGTGLGLALSRRLMEAHGGRIELTSTPGVGSRFTLVFPEPVASAPLRPRPSPEPTRHATTRAGERDILIIEDDPSAVRLLREYLDPDGYVVRVASDGELGLMLARERRPDAIVLDVLLPTIDGWEVLRRLKADPALRDIPVVIVTVVDERDVGLALGAVDYLVKPVQRDAIVSCLERIDRPRGAKRPIARVLSIDDEPAAHALVKASLEGRSFAVVSAMNGPDGVARARRGDIDLVICDMVMPGLDGFGVIAALQAEASTANIPVVICTARELSDDEKARLNGHILGVVTKGGDAASGLRKWLETAIPANVPIDKDAVA